VQTLGRDGDLRAQAELAAVREAGAGVDVDRRGIDFGDEARDSGLGSSLSVAVVSVIFVVYGKNFVKKVFHVHHSSLLYFCYCGYCFFYFA
jgi:hypothetical protein